MKQRLRNDGPWRMFSGCVTYTAEPKAEEENFLMHRMQSVKSPQKRYGVKSFARIL